MMKKRLQKLSDRDLSQTTGGMIMLVNKKNGSFCLKPQNEKERKNLKEEWSSIVDMCIECFGQSNDGLMHIVELWAKINGFSIHILNK